MGLVRTTIELARTTVVDADIGSAVQAYNSAIMVDGDIGTTVQAHDADTAKLDVNANFTGALQHGGSNVVVDTDIGSSVQAFDADTSKTDVAETRTASINMSDQLLQRAVLKDYSETIVALGSATAINLELGNVFSKTISGTTTFTFTNPPSAASGFTLLLTNGGSSGVTWPTTKWPAATAPTLTASGLDLLTFVWDGSAWHGVASGLGMA